MWNYVQGSLICSSNCTEKIKIHLEDDDSSAATELSVHFRCVHNLNTMQCISILHTHQPLMLGRTTAETQYAQHGET